MKAVLRCTLEEGGALSVMTLGAWMMLGLSVDNLAMSQVCQTFSIIRNFCRGYYTLTAKYCIP